MRKAPLALALWLLALPAGAEPRPFLDLDFEVAECVGGWRVPTTDRGPFDTGMDRAQRHSGKQSGRIRYTGEGAWTESLQSGGLAQAFPAADAAGKRVRFSADIQTEGVTAGSAGLFWTAFDESFKTVAAANTTPQGPKGTTHWTRHTLEVDVPAETRTIFFGVRLAGNGTAWFDGVKIEIDGVRWVEGPQLIPKPDPQAVSWLRREAIPFETARPGSGFADLQRLKPLIGDARVVALGEASHGTREFFQMKHRLVEFLATEMGFTHFAIEDSMPEAYRINEYVLTGEGDPRKLLHGLYWVWDTQEVLDMILWMREFNRSGKGRIQFLGFDMQRSKVAATTVLGFLRKADPEYADDAEAVFARVGPVKENRTATAEDAAMARGVLDHMTGRRADYLARFPREEVDWAIQSARVYLQDLQHISKTGSRERIMADNIGWIVEQAPPGSKVILWAHNFHVRKDPEGWMGAYLAERFGRDMFVFGFAFAEGRYNTQGPKGSMITPEAPPPLPGSAESYLRAAGLPRFVIDLRRVPESGPAAFLRQPLDFRNVGAGEVRCPFRPHQVTKEYDALIWFEQTTPSVLLPRGEAVSKATQAACRAIPGLDPLLEPGKALLLGEMHGTAESPAFLADVVCLALGKGLPVTVGLEIPREEKQTAAYMASQGRPEDRAALLSHPFWQSPAQDGRRSQAMLSLIERLRSLRAEGAKVRLILLDSGDQERDHAMAERVRTAREESPQDLIVTLTGNLHNRTVVGNPWDKNNEPMGFLLARETGGAVTSLDVSYTGGTAWFCKGVQPAICKVHPVKGLGQGQDLQVVLNESEESNGYHGFYNVGALTASGPAKDSER